MGKTKHEVRDVFIAAAAFETTGERTRYLDEACHDNPDLRARVEDLLSAHERDHPILTKGPEPGSMEEGPGSVIGHYKMLQEIGEGGFGVVFMAEQLEPVRRKVALKVVKPGMDSREVVARFEAERQALALMDHPNIAKVFDAGTTDTGRPYFVMELVRGQPVTDYCDEHGLPTPERLRLFTEVCGAIQHAHQKGLIHRDLKPSNILVTDQDGKAVPKVIDFGVAKALGQQLTEKTLFTAFQQVVGTPAYMSPEQTSLGTADLDTRSDVYSLGVLLYELLTGATPLDTATLHKVGLAEMGRLIRETEPRKPSTRLRTMGDDLTDVARHRHTEPSALTRLVHGELDWIVMKALEKDRARRYQTVGALAGDIEHHLAGEAVTAGPPSTIYRARKFVRRHKFGAVLAAAAVAAVLLSVAALAYGLVQARHERDRAIAAEARTEIEAGKVATEAAVSAAVSSFLLDDLLSQASPETQPDRDVKLHTLVDRAAKLADRRFADQPPVEFRVRQTLFGVYLDLGELKPAREQLQRAMEISRQQQLEAEEPTSLGLRAEEGYLLLREGHPAEAREIYKELLPIMRKVLGPEHPNTLKAMSSLALCCLAMGKPEQAQALWDEALPLWRRQRGALNPNTLKTMNGLAGAFMDKGKPTEAQKILEQVLPMWEQAAGPEHPGTLMTKNGLGLACLSLEKPDEARAIFEEILPVMEDALGAEHPYTLMAMNNLARSFLFLGKPAQAQELCEKIIPIRRQQRADDHPGTLKTKCNLALAYKAQGKLDRAEETFEDVLRSMKKVLGEQHPLTLETIRQLESIRAQQETPEGQR